MNDEEAKKKILARRAAFVAAAVASAGVGVACDSHPFACLEPPIASTATSATSTAPPQPCLSQPMLLPDAGATIDAGTDGAADPAPTDAGADAKPRDAGADVAREAGAKPHPCLSAPLVRRDAGPMPCLYVD